MGYESFKVEEGGNPRKIHTNDAINENFCYLCWKANQSSVDIKWAKKKSKTKAIVCIIRCEKDKKPTTDQYFFVLLCGCNFLVVWSHTHWRKNRPGCVEPVSWAIEIASRVVVVTFVEWAPATTGTLVQFSIRQIIFRPKATTKSAQTGKQTISRGKAKLNENN